MVFFFPPMVINEPLTNMFEYNSEVIEMATRNESMCACTSVCVWTSTHVQPVSIPILRIKWFQKRDVGFVNFPPTPTPKASPSQECVRTNQANRLCCECLMDSPGLTKRAKKGPAVQGPRTAGWDNGRGCQIQSGCQKVEIYRIGRRIFSEIFEFWGISGLFQSSYFIWELHIYVFLRLF